jgi:hypothetical protein
MNFYGLPEFIAYSMLLGISYNLIRQKQEERLQYWLIGWNLILSTPPFSCWRRQLTPSTSWRERR